MNAIGTYKEYQVRCYVCGELVAAKAKQYEELLLAGHSSEEALDEISDRYCTRQAIMTPAIKYLDIIDSNAVRGITEADPPFSMADYSVQAGGEEYDKEAQSVRERFQIEKEVFVHKVERDMVATKALRVNQIRVDPNRPFTSIGMPRSYMKWDELIERRRLENGNYVKILNNREWPAQ